jgi:hypothetical protein
MQNLPAFGQVSIGGLKLILSGPGHLDPDQARTDLLLPFGNIPASTA